jgi:hypothetical protein
MMTRVFERAYARTRREYVCEGSERMFIKDTT